jgi:GTPase SAR1 family protein
MGAANVGKSSFVNRLLENKYNPNQRRGGKDRSKPNKEVC